MSGGQEATVNEARVDLEIAPTRDERLVWVITHQEITTKEFFKRAAKKVGKSECQAEHDCTVYEKSKSESPNTPPRIPGYVVADADQLYAKMYTPPRKRNKARKLKNRTTH